MKNAENGLLVQTRATNYEKLLITDNFTGSDATLNVVAKNIIGLTITGGVNGFEVIEEI